MNTIFEKKKKKEKRGKLGQMFDSKKAILDRFLTLHHRYEGFRVKHWSKNWGFCLGVKKVFEKKSAFFVFFL